MDDFGEWGRHPMGEEGGFGEVFIEGQAAAGGPGSGVGDSQIFQQILQFAVFAECAMDDVERQIGGGGQIEAGGGDVHGDGIESEAGEGFEHSGA